MDDNALIGSRRASSPQGGAILAWGSGRRRGAASGIYSAGAVLRFGMSGRLLDHWVQIAI